MNTKAMTLRLPDAVHDALRKKAFERRTSITALVLESIQGSLDKAGTLCDELSCWNTPDRIVSGGFHFCSTHGPASPGGGGKP